MTYRVQENCVSFGPDLADLYDETRPFLPPIDTSKVLRKLCEQLTTRFAAESVVDLLEVGAGTGRLTLPIARHYHQLATGSERKVPQLRVTCIDMSGAMLDRLRKRHESFFSEHVEIVAGQPADVRDIQQPRGSYHAVLAHWVFHVMSDWRVAVYVIDQVLKDDGLVFLFREEAALYQAIDGDFREIQGDLLVLRLWSAFHRGRQSIAKRLASEGPVLPARFRLGSRVIDDRIERMFSALGWTETMELSDEPDRWRCTFTLTNVIEKIIRPRAFTNMRLFADEGQARKEFEQLADDLRTEFTPKQLNYAWNFPASFSGRMLTCPGGRRLSDPASAVLLHVARDTLGRRWRRQMDHTYNRDALWRRLFSRTWERLNGAGEGARPLAGLQLEGAEDVAGIFAVAPFAGDGRGLVTLGGTADAPMWKHAGECWTELAGRVEGPEPFVIVYEGRVQKDGTADAVQLQALRRTDQALLHPHVHMVLVNREAESALRSLEGVEEHVPGCDDPGEAFHAASRLRRQEPLWSVLEDAKRFGVIPFHDEDVEAEFIVGLARAAQVESLAAVYAFPFRADFRENDGPAIGLMVGSRQVLSRSLAEFLWALSDVIFNEYLEDILVDKEAKSSGVTESRPLIAAVNPRQREPVAPDVWRNAPAPAVLVITAADVEYKAVIELAGVSETLEARRRGIEGRVFLDLGFPKLPVWAIQCEGGSVGPGAAIATVLGALQVLKPKPFAVVMPGIAFGLQPTKQRLGDVLVSRQIQLYEVQKRNPLRIINRGDKPHCSDLLLQLLRGCKHDWGTVEKPEVFEGLMLSGEKLVNDPDFVLELQEL